MHARLCQRAQTRQDSGAEVSAEASAEAEVGAEVSAKAEVGAEVSAEASAEAEVSAEVSPWSLPVQAFRDDALTRVLIIYNTNLTCSLASLIFFLYSYDHPP